MTAVVGLLYIAEVALRGPSRWAALAAATVLLLVRERGPVRAIGASHLLGALILIVSGLLLHSPVVALLGLLLLVPHAGTGAASSLTLAALGVHLVWWRYLATFQWDVSPSLIAESLSWALSAFAYVGTSGVVVHGQLVRFSVVPVAIVAVPLTVALLRAPMGARYIVRFTGGLLLAYLGVFVVAITFAIAGHVHFFSSWIWPFTALTVGVGAAHFLPMRDRWPELAWARLTLIGLLLTLVAFYRVEPTSRTLQIAFDEAHGRWETVLAPFERGEYGRGTVYNYTLLARWLGTRHTVTALTEPWEQISSDVLVIKMPTSYYSDREKEAIDRFLRGGGLLIVIGDHTNLYGTSDIINDLLGGYGLALQHDAMVPWSGDHYDFAPVWWQESRYLRGVAQLQLQTAATIRSRHPFVLPVIVTDRAVAEDADYSNERFFGDLHPGPEDRHPPLTVAAERRVGHGRVLLFSDSTIFSTFSVMAPGNRELFQNFVERGTAEMSLWRVAALALLVVIGVWFGGPNRLLFAFSQVALVMILTAATWAATPPALDRYPAEWIEFDGKHSRMTLRFDPKGSHGTDLDDYSTFYAWVARLNLFQTVSKRPYNDPRVPTVIINPDAEFTPLELERIEQYLRRGGRILLLDDHWFSSTSTANVLLHRFGVALDIQPGRGSIHDPDGLSLPSHLLALPFELLRSDRLRPGQERARGTSLRLVPSGLTPLLVDREGTVIAGQRDVGAGRLFVFLRSTAFADAAMGDVWGGQEVGTDREQLYRLAYDLIELLRAEVGG